MKRHPAGALVYLLALASCRAPVELPVYSEINAVRLTSSLGAELVAEDLKGRVHVVDFIFTSCGAACPVMTAKMKQLYEGLDGVEGVGFLSVSTDPDRDTVAVLHDYAAALGIDETRWTFARAPMNEVKRLSEKEFLLAAEGFPIAHSQRFVLVDRDLRIRGYYDSRDSAELASLRKDVSRLLGSE